MRIEQLVDLLPENYTPADKEMVRRAYRVAEKAHEGQKRASGEPYVQHCLAVAGILTEYRVPAAAVAAGLLHDTVEDTDLTLEDIRRDFGNELPGLCQCGKGMAVGSYRDRAADNLLKTTPLEQVRRGDC